MTDYQGVDMQDTSTLTIQGYTPFGALIVTRRRNKRTGNFYANHYTLVFQEPSEVDCRRPSEAGGPITTPTFSTRPSKESSTPDKSDTLARPIRNSTRSVGGLNEKQRKLLRGKLMAVDQLLKDGHKFHDDVAQDAWQDFAYALEDTLGDAYADGYADLVDNGKWTVSAKVASPYTAGAELNKLINTAAQ